MKREKEVKIRKRTVNSDDSDDFVEVKKREIESISESTYFNSGENQSKKERILRIATQRLHDIFYLLKVSKENTNKCRTNTTNFYSFLLLYYFLFHLFLEYLRIVTRRDYQTWYKNVKSFYPETYLLLYSNLHNFMFKVKMYCNVYFAERCSGAATLSTK